MTNITNYKFLIKEKQYFIPKKDIENFPIKDALINMLVKKFEDKTCGVKLKNDAIVINSREEFNNFDLVVKIYNNPKINLYELLELEEFFDFIEECNQINSNHFHNYYNRLVIQKNPDQYKITTLFYENLMKEFDFYGIQTLFTAQVEEIDSEEVINRIEEYCKTNFLYNYNYSKFTYITKSIGGYFSGSFVLKQTLEEKWENSDIDIFVNENILIQRAIEYNNCPLHSIINTNNIWIDGTSRKTEVNQLYSDEKYDQIMEKYFAPQTIEEKQKCMITNLLKYEIANSIVNEYEGSNLFIVTDAGQYYGNTAGFRFLIKFTIDDVKIDLIITNYTVPHYIDNFDFNFCKVYYDGYTLHSLNWNSIYEKHSKFHESFNHRFYTNINRVRKYFKRGYFISIEPSKVYKMQVIN